MKLFRLTLVCALVAASTLLMAADSAQNLYKSKCQGCHGPEGKASAIGKKLGARDFSDPDVVKMSEADLVKITSDGKNKMPGYKGKLTEDQINDLVKYIKQMK